MSKPLSQANRVAAVVLAVVWLTLGLLAIAVGLGRHRWIGVPLGLLSAWYGVLWIRVARTGRWIWWPWPRP
jgi:hypothetical protein